MFADFDEIFKKAPESKFVVPDLVLKKMSEDLPPGTKYTADKHGNLTITPVNQSMKIGGFKIIIPDDFKQVLPKKYTYKEIEQLSYNSQRPLELKLINDNEIIVNGVKTPLDKYSFNIFKDLQHVEDKFYIFPYAFPKPLDLVLETNDGKYKKKITVSRTPYLSLDEVHYQSNEDKVLTVEVIGKSESNSYTITFHLDLRKAKSFRDVVENIFVYNAIIDGKIKIDGELIPQKFNNGKKYNENIARFYEKVLEIEEYLDLTFEIPQNDIDFKTKCTVEHLYQNLIENRPIKDREKILSLTGFNDNDVSDAAYSPGKIIYFQIESERSFDLFGAQFSLPGIIGLFNAKISSSKTLKDGERELTFEDADENYKLYNTIMCFKDRKQLEEFISKQPDGNAHDALMDAKYVTEYFGEK